MKVILVPSSVDLVGVSVHVYNLAKLLSESGLLDVVLCPRDGWLPQKLADSRIPHVVIHLSHRSSNIVRASLSLWQFFRSRKAADVVHIHGRFPLFISALSFMGSTRLAFVATMHQFGESSLNGPLNWKLMLETFLLRRMKRICCVSQDLRNEVLSRVRKKPSEVEVIPNWIEPFWAEDEPERVGLCQMRKSAGYTRICGIGYLSRVKGFDILLKSIGILEKQGYAVKCDIFGDGPEKEHLARLADGLRIRDSICFKEPSSDVRRLLPNYHALVIPSRSESFSIVALEAYDACVPVIASNVIGLRSTVLHAQTGLLFEPGNPKSLAAAMKTLINSETLANKFIANGTKYLQGYLPNDGLKRKYMEFYGKAQLNRGDGSLLVGNIPLSG